MNRETAGQTQEESKRDLGERVRELISRLLSISSLERLHNIKMVDTERYYRIENMLLTAHQSGAPAVSDEDFLHMLQQTEKKKKHVVYNRKSSILDLDD